MRKIILGAVLGSIIGFFSANALSVIPVSTHVYEAEPATSMAHQEHKHVHEMTAVAEDAPVPSVAIEAIADTKDGYNLKISTTNFTFTPESVNEAVLQNQGHAHIYVNDVKIARLYGNWFHLGKDQLQSGENEVTVTLNANDHSEWAIDGKSLTATVLVTK